MRKLSLLALLLLASCSTPHQLTDEGSAVKVAKTRPKNCSVIGKYKGIHNEGSVDLARNQAVNLAAKEGATDIYFDEEINNSKNWVVHATGFMCK